MITRRLFAALLLSVVSAGVRLFAADASQDSSEPSIQDELKSIRGQLPSQSHTMMDVAYHFGTSGLPDRRRIGRWPRFTWMRFVPICIGPCEFAQ